MNVVWTAQRPDVFHAECLFRQLAFSPQGAYFAGHPVRAADPDFVAREALHVFETNTPREVAWLPGPGVVRGFAWVDDSRLLCVREHKKGLRFTLHEMPDGGETHALTLPEAPQQEVDIKVSADGRRAVVAVDANVKDGLFVAVDTSTLAVLRELPGRFWGWAINGDGTWIAESIRELSLYALDSGVEDQRHAVLEMESRGFIRVRAWPAPDVIHAEVESPTGPRGVSLVRVEGGFAVREGPGFEGDRLESLPPRMRIIARLKLSVGKGEGFVLAGRGRRVEYRRQIVSGDPPDVRVIERPLVSTEKAESARIHAHSRGVTVALYGYNGWQVYVVFDED